MEIKYIEKFEDYLDTIKVFNSISKLNKVIDSGIFSKIYIGLAWILVIYMLILGLVNTLLAIIGISLIILATYRLFSKKAYIASKKRIWKKNPDNIEKTIVLQSKSIILNDLNPNSAPQFIIDVFLKIPENTIVLDKDDQVKIFENPSNFIIISLKNKRLRACINKRFLSFENIEKLYELKSYFDTESII
ncbi:MAG: hypothetical protein ACRDCZ_01840 [Culicoidibacterales bacterium]